MSKTKNPHIIGAAINKLKDGQTEHFRQFAPELQAEIISFLTKDSKHQILRNLSDNEIAAFLFYTDIDDSIEILQFVEAEREPSILKKITKTKREKIQKLLSFTHKTTGNLLDLNFIIVKSNCSLKDVANKMEKHIQRENRVPLVLTTNPKGKILGYIPYKKLILSQPGKKISQLTKALPSISEETGQTEIIKKIQDIKSEIIVVIDNDERPIGIIHLHDILKLIQKQTTQDVYKFAGVSQEETIFDTIKTKVKRRYGWLIINLATAFLASGVIALFEDTIAQIAILAVFMPIVAGEGGNAATQALTVVVRGLALKDISFKEAKGVIYRESIAGIFNGIIVGIVSTIVAIAFQGNPMIGVVLGLAMVINLFVAGFFGALVPFILKKVNIDPAVASSVFVTTATDIFGFLGFLGLATLLML